MTLHAGLGLIVTLKLHVEELPQASVAVELTVVTPRGNVLPDAGIDTIVTEEQLSIAVTVKLTILLHKPLVIFAGQVIDGAVIS